LNRELWKSIIYLITRRSAEKGGIIIQKDRGSKQFEMKGAMVKQAAGIVYESPEEKDPVSIYNRWAERYGYRFEDAETVALVLEHIRRLMKCERKDLERALKLDRMPTGHPGND